MEAFYQILALVGAGLIVWFLYRTVKGRPQVFSGENMNKSLITMGVLAIILIIFVAFLVLMVRS
ncbi:MAG: hypothetical protein A3F46_00095 [Legionellales bacterium RIFCSPHIGHO2_12_FULL_42_9]|nr:MAG: hypothetical protein A3F46_00095 [Legionellales bacterium RIFCSPHIGHO2_12_FULL_42_9]